MNSNRDRQNIRRARWLLRIGLAAVFLYAAVGATLQPTHWIGYLPSALTQVISAALALKLFSLFQLALALWLLIGWRGRWAAGLTMLVMAGIMFSNMSALEVTFRDVAILFGAAALFVLSE